MHFSSFVYSQAKVYGEKPAMWTKNEDKWEPLSWNVFASLTKSLTLALQDMGVKASQNVALFTPNLPESFITDFALFGLGAVSVPLFSGSTVEQLSYIVNDASISILFAGEQYQYDTAYEVLKNSSVLKKIIVFDDKVKLRDKKSSVHFSELIIRGNDLEKEGQEVNVEPSLDENETATIIYTSGTSGEPKGVMITHGNYLSALRIHDIFLNEITPQYNSIVFLPISHVFERTWSYFCMHRGAEIYLNKDPQEIRKTLKEIKPYMMCSVPRFWEKVYTGILDTVDGLNPFMQGIATWAVAIGSRYNIDFLRADKKPPLTLKIIYWLADKFVFSKIKKEVGIENARILPTAGAALSDEILFFLRSIGIPIVYGYGLTETTATVACFRDVNYKVGTVGKVVPEVQVKIGNGNEILVKGPTVFKGYYNQPEMTAKSFTPDNFFKTGDAGYMEKTDLILTERLKDLFKTSNGKYIAPQHIETTLIADKYIEQVAVIADDRNFVSAIIVPDLNELKRYAQRKNIDFSDLDAFLNDERIIDFISTRIAEQQKNMAGFEKIKRFVLVGLPFSIETGELTNTLKLRRSFILHKYKRLIDRMYRQ